MNRNLIIIGSVLVVTVVIYFVWKSRKKQAVTQPAEEPLKPGGIFAPKTLTEQDFIGLENVFKDGNPYNNEIAKAIEGQDQDENKPTRNDGSTKTLLTKSQFDNMVLATIRKLIGDRSAWIQQEEERRFKPWMAAARAGYNDSLARAFAYVIRVYVAGNNYYTSTANTTAGTTGTGTTPGTLVNPITTKGGAVRV